MARIAAIVTDMFEDSEYLEPVRAFREAGHEVVNVGLEEGAKVKGKREGAEISIVRSVRGTAIEEFDALLIPGGYSPDKLRVDETAVRFVGDFLRSGKPVFSICHGPQLLVTADVLRGRRLTGYKSIIQDIKNAGAEFVDDQVVEDGNLISSRNPGDLPAFIDAALNKL